MSNFFLEKHFFIISFRVLCYFQHYKIWNIEKCPFTYWLNGRWFLQIVDRDSGGGLGGGGGVILFLAFYAISNISRKNKFWEWKNKIFFCLEKQ